MRVLSFGSLNIDYVYSVDHMVTPGETLASSSRSVFAGGKGLNQSVALARAGAAVYHAGLVGPEGDMLLEVCQETGIDTSYVGRTDVSTGHTIIQVDASGQNSILLYGGANQQICPDFVDRVLEDFGEGDYLILQNEISSLPYLVDAASTRGMRVVLNPSPLNDALDDVDMGKVDLFLLNEIEGAQLSGGSTNPEEICSHMAQRYPEAQLVLTLGSAGSIYQHRGHRIRQAAYSVTVRDTTGAGDTFTGYFVWAMSSGRIVEEALDLAARASALAVTREGAVPSIPTSSEVEHFSFD